jgi:hypothetical protein
MRWWRVMCLLSVIPVAAAYHNVVLPATRSTCMLNPLHMPDWNLQSIYMFLTSDPSLLLAIASMGIVYALGLRIGTIRALVAPAFVSSILYSLWIWDIPFTGRLICLTIHDNRLLLWDGQPLNSRVVILVSLGLYLLALPTVLPNFKRFDAPAKAPAPKPAEAAAVAAIAPAGQPLGATNFSVEARDPSIG